jgi:hypothetical protein
MRNNQLCVIIMHFFPSRRNKYRWRHTDTPASLPFPPVPHPSGCDPPTQSSHTLQVWHKRESGKSERVDCPTTEFVPHPPGCDLSTQQVTPFRCGTSTSPVVNARSEPTHDLSGRPSTILVSHQCPHCECAGRTNPQSGLDIGDNKNDIFVVAALNACP